jgi:Rrf2 family protein
MEGFINSTPGYKGGYVLAKPSTEIKIKKVLEALGGALYDKSFCASHAGELKLCTNSVDCSARSLWQMIQFAVDQLLERVTLQDLVMPEKESSSVLHTILEQAVQPKVFG